MAENAKRELICGKCAQLGKNALTVLRKRYLKKDKKGDAAEKPEELFYRVAENIAQTDKIYDKDADIQALTEEFYPTMSSLDFLPNSPTLINAGRRLQQLSACFVLPIEDLTDSIFETLKNTALIHKSGGGTSSRTETIARLISLSLRSGVDRRDIIEVQRNRMSFAHACRRRRGSFMR